MVYKEDRWNESHVFPFIKNCTYLFMEPFFIIYILRDIDIISDCIAELHFCHCCEIIDNADYVFIYDTEANPFVLRNTADGRDTHVSCITRIDLANTLYPLVKEGIKEESECQI